MSAPEGPRRYDSPVRRERAAETRQRIVEAGAALVHEQASWDLEGLTVRAAARGAGVHERTVHRHFPTERDLRAAVLQHLFEESGVTVEGLGLDDLAGHVQQLFGYLAAFPGTSGRPLDPVLAEMDTRRKDAILATVAASGSALDADDQRLAAALIDVVWSLSTYQRLTGGWGLAPDEAARGASWLLDLLTAAIRSGQIREP